jgi:hypothetical protein
MRNENIIKQENPQCVQTSVSGSASLSFRVDTMKLLTEIVECALKENQGILKVPLNVFRNLLAQVAERASEINDPKLNILMLSLNLYEMPPTEIQKAIDNQKKIIKDVVL